MRIFWGLLIFIVYLLMRGDAEQILSQIRANQDQPLNGYSTKPFMNREGILDLTDTNGNTITYIEHDVFPHNPPNSRGAERIILGSDGRAYYTGDHYQTFQQIF